MTSSVPEGKIIYFRKNIGLLVLCSYHICFKIDPYEWPKTIFFHVTCLFMVFFSGYFRWDNPSVIKKTMGSAKMKEVEVNALMNGWLSCFGSYHC